MNYYHNVKTRVPLHALGMSTIANVARSLMKEYPGLKIEIYKNREMANASEVIELLPLAVDSGEDLYVRLYGETEFPHGTKVKCAKEIEEAIQGPTGEEVARKGIDEDRRLLEKIAGDWRVLKWNYKLKICMLMLKEKKF